jgi:hypothetical protein
LGHLDKLLGERLGQGIRVDHITRRCHHGLDVGDPHASRLASSDHVTREVKVVTVTSKPSNNDIPNHGETGTLIQRAADDVPCRVVMRVHSLDTDREPGSVTEIPQIYSVQLPIAYEASGQLCVKKEELCDATNRLRRPSCCCRPRS